MLSGDGSGFDERVKGVGKLESVFSSSNKLSILFDKKKYYVTVSTISLSFFRISDKNSHVRI